MLFLTSAILSYFINLIGFLNVGQVISEDEAQNRAEKYGHSGTGSFIYYGVKDIYGKSVW